MCIMLIVSYLTRYSVRICFCKSMILISENDDISIKKTSIHKIFNLNY